MNSDGATFTCSSSSGQTFTVTITNKNNGDYTVR
jgi:hypothetical protein